MQWNRTSGRINRQKNAGMAKWHNWTIGGVTPDGKDATNELSYLILEAAKGCQTPHHTITVRVHEGTPEALMLKALEVVRTGIGMPAFISDKSYIEYLLSQGVPLDLARDYIMTGCLDVNIVGQSRIVSYGMFIVPLVFDIFMHNGMDPNTRNTPDYPKEALELMLSNLVRIGGEGERKAKEVVDAYLRRGHDGPYQYLNEIKSRGSSFS